MTQGVGVVIEHLGEDVAPEAAQALACGEHVGSTARCLVGCLERLRVHVPVVSVLDLVVAHLDGGGEGRRAMGRFPRT